MREVSSGATVRARVAGHGLGRQGGHSASAVRGALGYVGVRGLYRGRVGGEGARGAWLEEWKGGGDGKACSPAQKYASKFEPLSMTAPSAIPNDTSIPPAEVVEWLLSTGSASLRLAVSTDVLIHLVERSNNWVVRARGLVWGQRVLGWVEGMVVGWGWE